MNSMTYQPIENYGIIGNMHSVALVGMNGSIDWLCLPRFDSPVIFGALLDARQGGRFQLAPCSRANAFTNKQFYWPETNVLVTRFVSPDGIGEVVDYMPVGVAPSAPGYHWLIRRVRVMRGTMTFTLECTPAFNYARDTHETTCKAYGVTFTTPTIGIELATRLPLTQTDRGVMTEFTLNEGDIEFFVLRELTDYTLCCQPISPEQEHTLFHQTITYWRRWIARCTYTGRWREMVHRSALVLKLLTYEPTGAIVAAPTTSLPEDIDRKSVV